MFQNAIPNHAGSSKSILSSHRERNYRYTYMLGPGSFYGLLLTLKPYCFNIFCCSICIPDNQTGSWPLGPWRSCRAVPHTHGCSEGKPRGRIQSWTPCCPGCCCPHWGSPHPSVQTLEGPKLGQAVGEVVADHVFPILSMKKWVILVTCTSSVHTLYITLPSMHLSFTVKKKDIYLLEL